jgi:hypothetical protein
MLGYLRAHEAVLIPLGVLAVLFWRKVLDRMRARGAT